jgi:hypothetical protein
MSYTITGLEHTLQAIFYTIMHYYLLHNCGFVGFLSKSGEVRLGIAILMQLSGCSRREIENN